MNNELQKYLITDLTNIVLEYATFNTISFSMTKREILSIFEQADLYLAPWYNRTFCAMSINRRNIFNRIGYKYGIPYYDFDNNITDELQDEIWRVMKKIPNEIGHNHTTEETRFILEKSYHKCIYGVS